MQKDKTPTGLLHIFLQYMMKTNNKMNEREIERKNMCYFTA